MRGERRKNFRVDWNAPATIYDLERRLARPCILSNFSNTGAKITGVMSSTVPDEFILRITRDRTHQCYVLWRFDDALGVKFIGRLTKAEELNLEQGVWEPVQ
jgi:PilZ domain